MGIINITSDRKNVTLDSDMILYITPVYNFYK